MAQQTHHQHEEWQSTATHSVPALSVAAHLISGPLHTWRGLFVSFYSWFGYYFFGFSQMPARVGAQRMPA